MASTITITCPECEKPLKTSSEVLGKKIRCKGCGAVFAAKGAVEKTAPAKAAKGTAKAPAKDTKADKPAAKPKAEEKSAASELDADYNPYGITEEYLGRRCPDCAEALDDEQVVCLHCGYNTNTRVKSRTRKVRDITGGDVFLWLLPGIACAILVLTLVGLDLYFIFQINRATFGEDEWYSFIGASGTKIWVTVVLLFICYLAGTFAVKRLILNYTPPEIEEKIDHKPK